MFFCPELRSTVGREEKAREPDAQLAFSTKQTIKKKRKKGMNLLRLSHGHKNSEYYF